MKVMVVVLAVALLIMTMYIIVYDREVDNLIEAQRDYIKAYDEYVDVLKDNLDYYKELVHGAEKELETIDTEPVTKQDRTIVYKMVES